MKLLWLADRYHIRKYGRTVLDDQYYAMKHGPIPTNTMNYTQPEAHFGLEYINDVLKNTKVNIQSISDVDTKFFSTTDLEALEAVWDRFGGMGEWDLRELSHEYPEWKKFEADINHPRKKGSYAMNFIDFFQNVKPTESNHGDFFSIDEESLEIAKETYQDGLQILDMLWEA